MAGVIAIELSPTSVWDWSHGWRYCYRIVSH